MIWFKKLWTRTKIEPQQLHDNKLTLNVAKFKFMIIANLMIYFILLFCHTE